MKEQKPYRLFEHEKKLLAIAGGVCGIGSCFYFVGNPEFYQGYDLVHHFIIIAMFLLVSACYFLAAALPSKGKAYKQARIASKLEDGKGTGGYISLDKMRSAGNKADKKKKSFDGVMRFLKIAAVIVCAVCVELVIIGDVRAMIVELSLPEIERSIGIFRLIVDIFMRTAELTAVVMGLCFIGRIMASRSLNTTLLKVHILI